MCRGGNTRSHHVEWEKYLASSEMSQTKQATQEWSLACLQLHVGRVTRQELMCHQERRTPRCLVSPTFRVNESIAHAQRLSADQDVFIWLSKAVLNHLPSVMAHLFLLVSNLHTKDQQKKGKARRNNNTCTHAYITIHIYDHAHRIENWASCILLMQIIPHDVHTCAETERQLFFLFFFP